MKRMFDITYVPFSRVSHDEKHIDNGVLDQVETYNIHGDVSSRAHPEALRPLLPEIDLFARHSHINVLGPILKLMALGLELQEETHSAEDERKTKNLWLKGHNVIMLSSTIKYQYHYAALQSASFCCAHLISHWVQILCFQVVNSGDAVDFLSGVSHRATIAKFSFLLMSHHKAPFEKDEDAPVIAKWRKARTAKYPYRNHWRKRTSSKRCGREALQLT
ncbi:hypothetical protein EV368DRAFT_69282 [Lentinula lateritia]|nr:hypothetical protein EV368DRAFT_69282 [Lentinula lateritia]